MNDRVLSFKRLSALAATAGLDLVGVAPAGPTPGWERYRHWIEAGYAAGMDYLVHPDAAARRADPRRILPEARTVLVVGASYASDSLLHLRALHGRVSRYAWGEDYHRWLLRRLRRLVQLIEAEVGTFPRKLYVDTGPVLERAWAQLAGLGWIGKNSTLLHPRWGSTFFLGVGLLGLEIESAPTPSWPSCGSCTRCLEACPTGALVAPGVLDARRCLSYLTIEHRGAIPEGLRSALGDHVFGCDRCQEVCPWNRSATSTHTVLPEASNATLYLPELLSLGTEAFRARFRSSALWRATPEGLARNAAVVLGNLGDSGAIPFLERAAADDARPLVRDHAQSALVKLRGRR